MNLFKLRRDRMAEEVQVHNAYSRPLSGYEQSGERDRSHAPLAQRLCESTGSDQAYVFTGLYQARQGALALARKWGQLYRRGASAMIVIGAVGSSVFADFNRVPLLDLRALHAAVDASTIAIIVEPSQTDAAASSLTHRYFQGVEKLCRELNILLILDEDQTDTCRCGALLCEEVHNVRADIVILGNGLGGDLPLAALLTRGHASTVSADNLTPAISLIRQHS
ncbi:MAG TPA: aminotransferase class III-fold pyridoxal phosphate-dependent enzyme [Pseudomonas sp.]|uniref:aminotransferase class III-fold pyridoxal phosphate-dependent enzyme n=1 Tax=Pseudomonas sp. TaxID=306 RepID=UPI002EDB9CEA